MYDTDRIELNIVRCFRALTALCLSIKESVYKELLIKESDLMISDFISARINVAQYQERVVERIYRINAMLVVFSDLGIIEKSASLLLQRDLLDLHKSFIDQKSSALHYKKKMPKITNGTARRKAKASIQNPTRSVGDKLNKTEEIILAMIKKLGTRIRTSDIMKNMDGVSSRTVKRALSELVRLKHLQRTVDGKKVFYDFVTQ